MLILSRLRFRTKLTLLLLFSSIATIATIVIGATALRERMIDDRLDKYRAEVNSTHELARALEARVTAKELTYEQAYDQFYREVHAIRFDKGLGYISVVDMRTEIVMILGANAAYDGKPPAVDTATNKTISRLVIDAVASSDEGTTSYMFPKPGATIPLRKLVAVAKFPAWNMVLYAGTYTDDLEAEFRSSLYTMTLAGGTMLLVTWLIAWFISRDITGSLSVLRDSMVRLAGGDLTTEVSGSSRRDEVGAMAGAVKVFKDNMVEAERLRKDGEQHKAAAEAERKTGIMRLADTFEAGIKGVVQSVALNATGMQSAAQSMTDTAETATQQATAVAASVERASANVQTVATATEELSTSVIEIGRQVDESSKIANRAVEEAQRTNSTVEGLSQSAQRIGEVVQLIETIAGQTNLLALNATIEAARAGDAGKGFAVVASEVKSLANQTAKATEEIRAQIGEIQGATAHTVEAIDRIGVIIQQMREIATAIASAVEQQGAATREIATNVHQAAAGTGEIATNIAGVSQVAGHTGTAAKEVLSAASELSRQAETLQREVDKFLSTVRAA